MSDAWHRFADFVDRVDELPVGLLVRRGCVDRPGRRGRRRLRRAVPERDEQGRRAGVPGDPAVTPAGPRRERGPRRLEALRDDRGRLLLLWGAEDRPLPPAQGEAFAAELGRPAPRRIAGAGHYLQEDQGEQVGALIADFGCSVTTLPPRALVRGALWAARAPRRRRGRAVGVGDAVGVHRPRDGLTRTAREDGADHDDRGQALRRPDVEARGLRARRSCRAAISSGETRGTPRRSGTPAASSVLAKPGMTTVTSTPVPRSSARTASERPITPCLVAQ